MFILHLFSILFVCFITCLSDKVLISAWAEGLRIPYKLLLYIIKDFYPKTKIDVNHAMNFCSSFLALLRTERLCTNQIKGWLTLTPEMHLHDMVCNVIISTWRISRKYNKIQRYTKYSVLQEACILSTMELNLSQKVLKTWSTVKKYQL